MKNLLMSAVILVSLWMLSACSETFEPREINKETDICKICNMSISHEDFAGQIVLKNGDYEVFDDLGCLIEYMKENDQSEIGKAYIKDALEDKWIDVENATYVYSKDYWTPMNYGVVAFETKEAADKWISSNGEGKFLSYDDLFQFNWGIHQ